MKVLILTGAGISADAGIPTFESVYGPIYADETLRETQRIARLNSAAKALCEDLKTREIKPTALHKAIATLPYDVQVFTQNVDSLHEIAGSLTVRHIHGTINNPVYFGGQPRCMKRFYEALDTADALVVIGTRLHYNYLQLPISDWAFQNCKRVLILDPKPIDALKGYAYCGDKEKFITTLVEFLGELNATHQPE